MTVTTADTVQTAIVNAITGKTAAGANVYTPRTWPIALAKLPIVLVQSPRERKESLGPNAPSFDVFATIRVVGRLTFVAIADDQAAKAALAALAILQRQIEVAVINDFDLFVMISEMTSVEATSEVKSDGQQPIAELTMDFVCKFYQGPEAFAQPTLTPFDELAMYADMINVFDPSKTYVPPFPYVPTPAPRTAGPDGRVEGIAVVTFPE